MINKYYYAEVLTFSINGSQITGSYVVKVPFWKSPSVAYNMLDEVIKESGRDKCLVNFKKL